MSDRVEKCAVQRLADKARCANAWATAMIVTQGADAWSRCVRENGHDGDCVKGLSRAREVKLATFRDIVAEAQQKIDNLQPEIDQLLEMKRLAEEAWMT